MNAEEMEMLLWDYVDGRCTAEETACVQEKLQKDSRWQRQYEEILAFSKDMQGFEAEQPSLRFNRNVMEAIAEVKPVRIVQRSWVVWGLAAFFVATIVLGLIWTLSTSDSYTAGRFSMPDWSINSRGMQAFLLGDVVVALLLVDHLLRRRRAKSA